MNKSREYALQDLLPYPCLSLYPGHKGGLCWPEKVKQAVDQRTVTAETFRQLRLRLSVDAMTAWSR